MLVLNQEGAEMVPGRRRRMELRPMGGSRSQVQGGDVFLRLPLMARAGNRNYGLNRNLLNPVAPQEGEVAKFIDRGGGVVQCCFRCPNTSDRHKLTSSQEPCSQASEQANLPEG
eukprot:755161-Hanusia_phi.AAC.2